MIISGDIIPSSYESYIFVVELKPSMCKVTRKWKSYWMWFVFIGRLLVSKFWVSIEIQLLCRTTVLEGKPFILGEKCNGRPCSIHGRIWETVSISRAGIGRPDASQWRSNSSRLPGRHCQVKGNNFRKNNSPRRHLLHSCSLLDVFFEDTLTWKWAHWFVTGFQHISNGRSFPVHSALEERPVDKLVEKLEQPVLGITDAYLIYDRLYRFIYIYICMYEGRYLRYNYCK